MSQTLPEQRIHPSQWEVGGIIEHRDGKAVRLVRRKTFEESQSDRFPGWWLDDGSGLWDKVASEGWTYTPPPPTRSSRLAAIAAALRAEANTAARPRQTARLDELADLVDQLAAELA